MDLRGFLTALALDPILVEDFLDDPDRVMDRHEIPASVRAALRSGDDVAILGALLGDNTADGDGR
jgi:hypothetical protein